MPTISVESGSVLELQAIADAMGKSRKMVVITGAGISTNCGIPDFRSQNGLYSLIQEKYDSALLTRPWDNKDNYDIDDRPKKKRKTWFYEVVAPDGTVVNVIDPELDEPEDPAPKLPSRKSSKSKSSSPSNSPPPPSSQSKPQDAAPTTSFRSTRSKSLTSTATPPPQGPQQPQEVQAVPTSRRPSISNSPLHSSSPLSSPPPSSPAESASTSEQPDDSSSADSSIISSIESSQSSRTDLPNLKGRDLFDSMVWKDPFTTSIHYMFISSLREKIKDVSSPTPTHEFIKSLQDVGRLVRNYTQNIDCLEERLGMGTDLTLGAGNSKRFHAKVQRERWEKREKTFQSTGQAASPSTESDINAGVPVVQLHGSLAELRCGLCLKTCSWEESERATIIGSGQAPDCPFCMEYNARRTGRGRRGLAVGRLRPDIVLYGEEHPKANLVGPIITHDLALGPDVLLILGTSLRVHGLKVIVKEFAKTVHDRGGKVIFVNRTKPPESTWKDTIDYWVGWDCDAWVLDLQKRRPDIWSPPSSSQEDLRSRISLSRRESSGDAKQTQGGSKPRPQCIREDRHSAAYFTFKILDVLRPLHDKKGEPAAREQKWPDLRKGTGNSKAIFKSYKGPTKSLPTSKAPPAQPSKNPTNPSKSRKKATAGSESSLARSCVMCVKRRAGCDKKFPCERCTRMMVKCIPSQDLPPSPQKRKSLPSFSTNGQPALGRKSLPSSSKEPTTFKPMANSSRKRKQPGGVPEDTMSFASITTDIWDRLRNIAPSLSAKPSQQVVETGRMPLTELHAGIPQDYKPYSYDFAKQMDIFRESFPSHIPDMHGLDTGDMPNLITHPPMGYIPAKPAPRHSYGTRSARNSMYAMGTESTKVMRDEKPPRPSWGSNGSNETTIVVDGIFEEPTQELTPPDSASMTSDSAPMTPDSKRKRIKRMGSIGAILSSSPNGTEIFQDALEVASSSTEAEVWHDAKVVLSSSPEIVIKGDKDDEAGG